MIVLLSGILIIAILSDLASGRIPNILTGAGLIISLLFGFLTKGPPGFACAIINVIICFLIIYILYIIKALGAGDIKLILVIASFLGAIDAIKILFISMVIFVSYGFVKHIISDIISKNNISKNIIKNVIKNFGFEILNKRTKIKFSPAILLAYILTVNGA